MGIQINDHNIIGMRVNGYDIVEARTNGKVVWPETVYSPNTSIFQINVLDDPAYLQPNGKYEVVIRINKLDNSPLIVDWGDGSIDTYNNTGNTRLDHSFNTGIHTITLQSNISSWDFRDWWGRPQEYLTKLVLGDNYSEYMSYYTFESCNHVVDIVLSSSMTNLNDVSFTDCRNLESLWIPASILVINNWGMFYDFEEITGVSLTINCEAGSKPQGWDDRWNIDSQTGKPLTTNWGVPRPI